MRNFYVITENDLQQTFQQLKTHWDGIQIEDEHISKRRSLIKMHSISNWFIKKFDFCFDRLCVFVRECACVRSDS